ncbi:cathepsin O-like [Venturia canescens]|uniref:cathepsin O-like n=1 Tax=Venturia canescens TaxID=32260 RepID=UPI001C9BF69E|nr:cathepsin O-like [Venturia canescens]
MEWRTVIVTVLGISLCFLVIPIRVGPSTNVEDVKLFESYIVRYNKSYRHKPSEYDKRFERFQRSLRYIEKMNELRDSEDSALYGQTEFSDMSEDEFLTEALRPDLSVRGQRHLRSSYHKEHRCNDVNKNLVKRATPIPLKFDWRIRGAVTPVRSQGTCGACWAFSTVECIESMIAIKNGTLRSYSVQEMIDCAGNSNFGCEGGDICSLLNWLLLNKVPILPEKIYPVTGKSDACKLDKSKISTVRVTDFTCDSYVGAEDDLLSSLVNHGPVAAAVNALAWQNYLGGIIKFHCDGAFTSLNHAVQIVGYDKTGPTPYYIVRNSWGTLFGNKGYLYIAIGSNMCGIANQVSSVDVTWK